MRDSKASRLFYAVEFPTPIQRIINNSINDYKVNIKDPIKWVNVRSLHLTLRFIGEVSEKIIPLLKSLLDNVVKKYKPFKYELNGIGYFPNSSKPRVIFIDVGQGKEQIIALANEIEETLVHSIGLPPERKIFKPHITIGRLKGNKKPHLSNKCIKLIGNDKNKIFGKFIPEYCSLIKSVLTKDGPIYTAVHKSFFNI